MTLSAKSRRILSLDIFRAITMFLMLFVNEFAGVKGLPHWLYHAQMREDMMGFSDTIFPAFLFAMGMAIPFAVQNRFRKGDTTFDVLKHILLRSVALIVMGLFTVNKGSYDAAASGIPSAWYSLLMVTGFFLIWNVYPKADGWKKYVFRAMKIAGIALLAYLFVIFVPKEGQSFGVKWWGILGLIGWSYLGCSLIYLLTRDYLGRNVAVMLLLVACSLLTAAGVFKSVEFVGYIPSQPVLYSLSMAGVLASVIMKKYASTSSPGRFIAVMLAIGIVMFGAGLFAHKYWIISKILATPTWLFYCCAMYFPLFALIYWIVDVKGRGGWFDVIKPAGTLTLTCYIIPYITGSLMSIMHVHWPAVTYAGTPGLVRSALYSLAVVWIAWLLSKIHIKLKI